MNIQSQLYTLCSIRGKISEGRLLGIGISRQAIGKALTSRALRRCGFGLYETTTTAKKLAEILEGDLEPGQEVFRFKDGALRRMQVVKDEGSKVSLVDPEEKQVSDEDEESILTSQELEQVTESIDEEQERENVKRVFMEVGLRVISVFVNGDDGSVKVLVPSITSSQILKLVNDGISKTSFEILPNYGPERGVSVHFSITSQE